MASPAHAKKLKGQFPANLEGEPLLLPGKDSALHGSLPRWLDRQGVRMQIVGEFDDSALMKAFGEGGAGVFPAAIASLSDVVAHYRVEQVGATEEIRERFFLISPERRLSHPAARAVSEHAHAGLFAGAE
jgi:LysR family transcriptional activator of nhaA